jgi:XamI restriction endonuclease
MRLSNARRLPRVWTDEELAEHARRALNAFVDRRLAEPSSRYIEHLKARRAALHRLVRVLAPLDTANPDIAVAREILRDPELEAALRYLAGPPISADDLGVVVTRATRRLTKRRLNTDPSLATDILRLICRLADVERFPWVKGGRQPRRYELKQAIRATTAMHAAQTMQTERRNYGKQVERHLESRLINNGFVKAPSPNAGKIDAPIFLPKQSTFYGECDLYGRRADLLIGLPDGRSVAVEAKDSASVVNSLKRVLNDTAAKADFWHGKLGESVIPVALLSGVFGVSNLKSAQARRLYLVWSDDLDGFADWIADQ